MAEQVLAKNYVEFIARGLGEIDAATERYHKKLEAASKGADGLAKAIDNGSYRKAAEQTNALNQRMAALNEQARKIDLEVKFGKAGAALVLANEGIEKFKSGSQRIAGPAAAGFAILTGAVLGFVRAGLAGTVQGEMLTYRITLLSREIAGIFMPVITGLIGKLQQLVMSFRALTGEKQAFIMKVILATAAGLALAMIFPKILGGIQIVIIGIKALMAIIAAAGTEAGIASGGLLPLLGLLITAGIALIGFMSATKAGAGGLDRLQAAGKQIIDAVMPPLTKLASALGNVLERLATVVLPLVVSEFERWANIIELVANAIDGLVDNMREMEKHIPQLKYLGLGWNLVAPSDEEIARTGKGAKQHQAPTQAGSGFEDFLQTYKRIAAASAGTGLGAAEATAQNTREMADALNKEVGFWEVVSAAGIPLMAAIGSTINWLKGKFGF